MTSVFKYEIIPNNYVEIQLPRGAKILSVQNQKGTPFLWALVDTGQPKETRKFRLAGTGHPIEDPMKNLKFIDTFQMYDGDLIFHFFEIVK